MTSAADDRSIRLRDLRATLAWLQERGDLVETNRTVNPDLEVTGLQKHFDGSCPLLFNSVKDKPNHRVVTNLFGDIKVINALFGWSDDTDRTRKLARALVRPLAPIEVPSGQAPSHEVIVENPDDVRDYIVPIRHTAMESELTVGSGIRLLSGPLFDGGTDVGYNRMNFRWGNVGTFQIAPGSHMWQVLTQNKGVRIPITINFGVPAAVNLLAGAAFDYVILPHGCDEIGVAGAIQGAPVRIVKARTVDAFALADAETVLEGYIDAADRRYETAEAEADGVQGKHHFHPEWAGYMGKAYKAATLHVTAVTTRRIESRPIVFALGAHTLDEHNIDTTIREAAMFALCERMQPGLLQDVNIPYSMTDWGGAIIQVKKRNPLDEGWQRNFLTALLATSQGMRLAIAVSEDVDIYDMDDIMWNLTTRVNPRTDLLNPTPGGRGQTFMPAERMTAGQSEWTGKHTHYEGGLGVDATVPFGYEGDFMRPVYPVDRVRPEDFFTPADIENARGRMAGWVRSLARTGR